MEFYARFLSINFMMIPMQMWGINPAEIIRGYFYTHQIFQFIHLIFQEDYLFNEVV